MHITTVAETHIHADFLSGTRELAAATGAAAYVSGEGGADWQYGFEAKRLHEGETIALGNITITARHTPGHTPEHLSYLVTDGAFTDEPGYYLTGDFVFSGDVGRPDLLDEAAGGQDTRFAGAKDLFASLKEAFLTLPDHVQVYPGHGAGSACGKALGALPATTVGYERKFAWWAPYLAQDDEQGFIDELLAGQPDAHAYFARMKRQNKQGPALLGELSPLQRLDTTAIAEGLAAGSLVFVDTRSKDEVHQATVTGALNIPGAAKAATYGAWSYDPEAEDTALVLLAPDAEAAEEIRDHLVRVGIDAVAGYTPTLEGLPTTVPARVAPAELESFLASHQDAVLVDVRNRTEHADGHVPGSVQLNAGKVIFHPDQLPAKDAGPLVTYCQSGVRNAVAAAALRRAGYDVVELEGSYAAWNAWNARQNTDQTATAGAAR
jgi:hydroxyacylglutathione hydrolase